MATKRITHIDNPLSKKMMVEGLIGYPRRISQMDKYYSNLNSSKHNRSSWSDLPPRPKKDRRYYPISPIRSIPDVGYKTPIEAYFAYFRNPYDTYYSEVHGNPVTKSAIATELNRQIKVLYAPYEEDIAFYESYFSPENLSHYPDPGNSLRDPMPRMNYFINYATARLKIMRPTNRAFMPEPEHYARHRSSSSRSRRRVPVLSDKHGTKKYGSLDRR